MFFSFIAFGATNAEKRFYKAFTPIKEEVLDESGYFSFSEVTGKLKDLFALAQKIGETSKARFELYDLYSLVLSKKPEASQETIAITLEMLEIFKNSPFLDNETQYRAQFRLSDTYEYEGDLTKAIAHKKEFLRFFEQEPSSPSDTILYQKGLLAYLYHENGQYQEALQLNLAIENAIKKHIDEYAFKLYNNIAQNYYELHNFEQAKAYLEKRLNIAREYDDTQIELDTLFQLAVLAFEHDEIKKAETLFTKRVEIAKSRKLDADIVTEMQEDLEIMYEKLK